MTDKPDVSQEKMGLVTGSRPARFSLRAGGSLKSTTELLTYIWTGVERSTHDPDKLALERR